MNAQWQAQEKAGARVAAKPVSGGFLQRKCARSDHAIARSHPGERHRNGGARVQRAAVSSEVRQEAPPIVHEVLRAPGQPLDNSARGFFEPRFGHDFSGVRVHTDSKAAESARLLNSLAYTLGPDTVFAAGQYAPGTFAGRQLIAHELAHVVQQEGRSSSSSKPEPGSPTSSFEQSAAESARRVAAGQHVHIEHGAGRLIQRDLATPLPTPAPAAQPDLTEDEIREALRYNRARYDEANTRLIQNILGGPVTGRWTRENILAIAETQEQYGLGKDGKVGPDTFRFIVKEQRLEEAPTTTENCLAMFRVVRHPVQTAATPGPNGTTRIRGHHVVEAQFSSRCGCSEFQYRQFIAGTATGSRGGVAQDLSGSFPNIPGGALPLAMQEDGMTNCPGVNYGHRDQVGQASTTAACGENRYIDDAGSTDQTQGCIYRGEDFPQLEVTNLNTGDDVDLLVQFRGEIRRNGAVIQTKRWTTIDTTVRTP